jgi:transcription elongation GreA/GreB family factor
MSFKQKVHGRYRQLIQDRIDVFRDMIAALAEDAQNDAKSSAGDKHETGLSMMHMEQEKLTAKLQECLDQKAVIDRIDPAISAAIVSLGSLVKANGIFFFLSAALPKITLDGMNVLALSPQSPLGSKLIGNQVGHVCEINSTTYTIQEIL